MKLIFIELTFRGKQCLITPNSVASFNPHESGGTILVANNSNEAIVSESYEQVRLLLSKAGLLHVLT